LASKRRKIFGKKRAKDMGGRSFGDTRRSSGGFFKYFLIIVAITALSGFLFQNRQKINDMVNSKFLSLTETKKEKPAVGYKKADREELKSLLNEIK